MLLIAGAFTTVSWPGAPALAEIIKKLEFLRGDTGNPRSAI
jgi:hypothetical protein